MASVVDPTEPYANESNAMQSRNHRVSHADREKGTHLAFNWWVILEKKGKASWTAAHSEAAWLRLAFQSYGQVNLVGLKARPKTRTECATKIILSQASVWRSLLGQFGH